ncbi:MAG: hypothetical protein ABIJ16_06760 [Bacteroidota bacterium]
MKPFKTFLFTLCVLFLLGILMAVFPKDGIKITNNWTIKFPDIQSFFFTEKVEYADISGIINIGTFDLDSIFAGMATDSSGVDTIRVSADSLRTVVRKIEFGDSSKSALYPFFEKLCVNNGLIHVMHYGDSQIEGDRITGVFRNRLQATFGGNGIGVIPAVPIDNIAVSVEQESSDNWKRYTIFGKKDTTIKENHYGALGIYARFAPVWDNNKPNDSVVYEAWLKFKPSPIAYPSGKIYNQIRIFYGYNQKPVMVEVYEGDELKQFETMMSNSSLNVMRFSFESTPKELTLKFMGKDSPDIYGISFENPKGVAVDNIAMRGSAGLDFTRMDMSQQRQMYELLNTKLLILQFGVNVVPNVVEDYSFYENWFYNQLAALKRVNPDMSIIVISVSDMAMKKDDYYESYPNIEKIRNAQRKAAFRADCAFWDFYEAMGGKNSMPSWVFAEPPLATYDFTHLNHNGARIIGEMFFNSFILDDSQFLRKKKSGVENPT